MLRLTKKVYYNKKYNRIGHLFQDRFLSESITNDHYLLTAVRYIHNNPVKAGICRSPYQYRWSSANRYVQQKNGLGKPLVSVDFILNILSPDRQRAIQIFNSFSQQISEELIMDIEDKPLSSEREVEVFIKEFIDNKGIVREDLSSKPHRELRTLLIRELRAKSNLSNRKIAQIMGIDRNIVQRTK